MDRLHVISATSALAPVALMLGAVLLPNLIVQAFFCKSVEAIPLGSVDQACRLR